MMRLGLWFLALVALCYAVPAKAQAPTPLCQYGVNAQGCTAIANAIGTTSTAVESSHVMKAASGTLSGFQANNTNASARWIIAFDASTVPANGTLTGCGNAQAHTAGCVLKWYQIGASTTMGVSWSPGPPLRFENGLVLTCSSTGPFTLTLSADCTFSGEIN